MHYFVRNTVIARATKPNRNRKNTINPAMKNTGKLYAVGIIHFSSSLNFIILSLYRSEKSGQIQTGRHGRPQQLM